MILPPHTRYEGSIHVHDDPVVCVFENFLGENEIHHLIQAGRDGLKPAQTIVDSGKVENTGRTGKVCWIPQHHDPVIAALAARISAVVSLPLTNSEPFQLVHYTDSQSYAPHFDGWNPATEAGKRCMARGGQRLVTCLLYLNDVPGSGATVFPRLKIGVDARKGRMLLFHNCANGTTELHPDAVHGGMPVRNSEKWICNLWFRERHF
ncbi:MAG: 2OG-Fe(II) oxygenase [Gammaproteobacteria bacterium]|nr:2OG-Fe(II) oxygenase [Gammaproteobacteria bacterium]MDP2139569.1 2OG-Fe(II) oxygenase [Gammaproteobacteria bacterium]MDP2346542.1 2OG-Fe(II) oxygenase [Gammaproteobacteria bacterium]